MKSFTLVKDKTPKIEDPILNAINESINIEIVGDPDKFVGKNIQVVGKEELAKELKQFYAKQRNKTKQLVIESLIKQNFQVLNLDRISEQIEYLTKAYESTLESSPICPCDIFSSEDYETAGNLYTLTSLNNIPDEYKEYLNPNEVKQ